ncbi:hypothetical protein [Luteimonas abyssi]|uniref:hypothetical protein n=1 Tax=Luteimonas abyssi TaxID=1247514 RepID=UPI0012F8EB8F|nr:hypothetical protein [Luteimonas abyssi]
MKKQLALSAFVALSLGFAASAAAAPTTPCTADNQGAQEIVPFGAGGGALYMCLGPQWVLVGTCDAQDNCVLH